MIFSPLIQPPMKIQTLAACLVVSGISVRFFSGGAAAAEAVMTPVAGSAVGGGKRKLGRASVGAVAEKPTAAVEW